MTRILALAACIIGLADRAYGQRPPVVEFEGGAGFVFGGFALEALATRRLASYVALKAGLTWDFNFDTSNFQPVAFAVIRF